MCCGTIRLYCEFFYNYIFWSYPELLSKIGTGVHIILVGLEGFGENCVGRHFCLGEISELKSAIKISALATIRFVGFLRYSNIMCKFPSTF